MYVPRQQHGDDNGKNWKRGKCKGLIPYAQGGRGVAGKIGADFFLPRGMIHATAGRTSMAEKGCE